MAKARKIRSVPISKEEVLATGTRVDFVVCPLCTMSRKITRGAGEAFRFDKFDFDRFFLDVRYGGGLQSGFYRNESECMTLEEVVQAGEHNDLIEQLREKCREILEKTG